MLYGLQAGFGVPFPAGDLQSIKDLAFDLVRLDCQECTAEQTAALNQEVLDAGLHTLVIVKYADQMLKLPAGTRVELYNEVDYNPETGRPKITPAEYHGRVFDCAFVARDNFLTLYAGGVSNFNQNALQYLTDTHPETWPDNVRVSIHRYPWRFSPKTPQPGFRNRMNEFFKFRNIIGDRKFGVSEFGYHSARQWFWKIIPWRWDDREVAENINYEWSFWKNVGADFAVLYQLNDGPNSKTINRYGIRKNDSNGNAQGPMKPSAFTVLCAKGLPAF